MSTKIRFNNIFQFGNHKLPKTIAIFNLPCRITCPRSTPYCRKICYARKAERLYPNVIPYRFEMYRLSRRSDFVDIINDELRSTPIETVRIHESGDFYSQEYVNKWIQIAYDNPAVIFYAYTKSYHLDFSQRSLNFIIRLSLDKTSSQQAKNSTHKFDGVAWTVDRGETGPGFKCPMDCRICDYCLQPGDVYFEKH